MLLEARTRAGIAPVESRSVAEIRAAREAWRLTVAPNPIYLPHIDDLSIPVAGGSVALRVYRPAPGLRPVVVYFHGGGWVLGDLEHSDAFCRRLCRETGCAVVNVDYRLAPEHRFPTPAEDCLAAFDWIAAGGDAMLDPGRIAVAGSSAGGNLAASVSLICRERGGQAPVAQFLAYPVLDPACDAPSFVDYADGFIVSTEDMRWYWRQYLATPDDAASIFACPLRAEDLAGLPSTLVITAGCDPVRDDGERFARRLAEARVPAELSRYEGVLHGFLAMEGTIAKAEPALAEAAAFLRRHLFAKETA